MTHVSILPAANTETITPCSEAEIDRELAERLRTLSEPSAMNDECLEPLGGLVFEAVLWLSGAALLWVALAMHFA